MSTTDLNEIDELLAAFAPAVVDHLNEEHDDAVLFVGRWLTDHREANRARLVGVDRCGVDVELVVGDEAQRGRIDFAEEVTDVAALGDVMTGLLQRAHVVSGDDTPTSIEREDDELARTRTFLLEVRAVEDAHAHLRRVTVGGDDLATFQPAGPDTFLYLLLPPPGRTELTIGHDFAWSQVPEMPEDERPVGAYYTLREWRPEQRELDLLVVLHGDSGPASAWARRAAPGDPLALWGPRSAYRPPEGTDSLLLVADETGLPAVATIIESAPAGMPIVAVVEVADGSEQLPLADRPDLVVHWLHRGAVEAGLSTLLVDRIRRLDLPGERTYVWGGAESRAMTAVRRHVRDELGLDREAVSLVAYWRHPTGPTRPAA